MNYILFNKGKTPEYLKYCINSILSCDKNSKIYLITNQNIKFNNINIIQMKELAEGDDFKNSQIKVSNSELLLSFEKLFYINKLIKKINIEQFVHFDNNVIIYQPFSNIEPFAKNLKTQ